MRPRFEPLNDVLTAFYSQRILDRFFFISFETSWDDGEKARRMYCVYETRQWHRRLMQLGIGGCHPGQGDHVIAFSAIFTHRDRDRE